MSEKKEIQDYSIEELKGALGITRFLLYLSHGAGAILTFLLIFLVTTMNGLSFGVTCLALIVVTLATLPGTIKRTHQYLMSTLKKKIKTEGK